MTKGRRVLLKVAILLAALVLYAVFLAYTTFSNSGDGARLKVSGQEQPYLAKYDLLSKGMTHEQIVSVLGPPDRDALGKRYSWRVNGNGLSQIAVYYDEGRARKIRWLHVGQFILEK